MCYYIGVILFPAFNYTVLTAFWVLSFAKFALVQGTKLKYQDMLRQLRKLEAYKNLKKIKQINHILMKQKWCSKKFDDKIKGKNLFACSIGALTAINKWVVISAQHKK